MCPSFDGCFRPPSSRIRGPMAPAVTATELDYSTLVGMASTLVAMAWYCGSQGRGRPGHDYFCARGLGCSKLSPRNIYFLRARVRDKKDERTQTLCRSPSTKTMIYICDIVTHCQGTSSAGRLASICCGDSCPKNPHPPPRYPPFLSLFDPLIQRPKKDPSSSENHRLHRSRKLEPQNHAKRVARHQQEHLFIFSKEELALA